MSDIQERKAEMLVELAALGVIQLVVEYSGSGDSGQIDSVSAFTAADRSFGRDIDELYNAQAPADLIPIRVSNKLLNIEEESLRQKYENFAYEALEYVGATDWYNNEGGGGTMTVYVEEDGDHPAGTIHFAHYFYTRETTSEDYEL